MNNFLNEYFGFCFELNFELNHFSAQFNEKMNFQNVSPRASHKSSTGRCSNQPGDAKRPKDVYTSREEEWQFPSQIMPVVRDTVAHAGFKITKVDTSYP